MSLFNIAVINTCTEAEGPYKRVAIWFQGCLVGCPGCCNPDLIPLSPKRMLSTEQLVNIIVEAKLAHQIEGVTYLGGEPTMQRALPELTARIKALGLGVIAFTGCVYENVADLLEGCDMVIDGPFISSQNSLNRKIIGSDNQRIIHITDRYKKSEGWFYDSASLVEEVNICDYSISYNGSAI